MDQTHDKPPLVIGLAGGIGSGKSALAAAFGRAGCAVIDSDAEARRALQSPEVARELVKWWGSGVLDPRGGVDRAAVARHVFGQPAERARLEGLIHPRIRRTRAAAQEEARRAGAPAIIYDAPLLFEVGIDAVCDAVVFVDCPRETRLERLKKSRGWDDAELTRREAAQLPLEEKRSRSRFVVQNPGAPADAGPAEASRLDQQAREILAILLGVTGRAVGPSAERGQPNSRPED